MPVTSPQGTLDFKKVDKITFVGASSNTVIDTTTGSVGIGVVGDALSSNLHVVGDTRMEGNINMLHTSNTASIKLNSNVVTEFPRSKKLIKYPRVTLTADAQSSAGGYNGYIVNQSSVYASEASHGAWNSFAGNQHWLSSDNSFDGGDDVFNDTNGPWISIQLPTKIKLEYLEFSAGVNRQAQLITSGSVYASNGGSNWINIGSLNNLGTYSNIVPAHVDFTHTTLYDRYLLHVTTNATTYVHMEKLSLFGVPEYDPEAYGTDVVVKSVPNVPNTDWLEVYYDGQDYTADTDFDQANEVLDKSGNNLHGSQTGGVGFDSTYKAFTFGAGDYIQTQTLPSTFVDDAQHSIAIWFNLANHDDSRHLFWIDDNTTGVNNQIPHAVISSAGILRYDFFGNHLELLDQIVTNQWYHLVITFSGGNHSSGTKFYINGVHNTNVATGGANAGDTLDIQASSYIVIGANSGGTASSTFNGKIANFRLFNRALTSDEAWQLYAYQKEYFGHGDLGMTLKAGRLGIGTSEPRAALDVRGSANFSTINIDGVIKSNGKLIVGAYSGDGSSNYPALSGWHLAQLNNMYNLGLTNGFYYIQSPIMPNPLQMYVNFTADGGGYDFYRYTSATSTNFVFQDNGARSALGLDIFYPRSQAHWAAIYDFVVNVMGSTVINDIKVAGAVHSNSNTLPTVQNSSATESYTDNYANFPIRDPRYYGSGVPDWKVPDGGKWWLRDSYSEPNGDYVFNAYLSLSALDINGTPSFNDGNANTSTGTTIICSTNVKGSSPMYM